MQLFLTQGNIIVSNSFPVLYLSVLLVFASITDFRYQKIPNYLTLPTILCAMIYHFLFGGVQGVLFSLLGLLTGFAVLILPYAMGGMGAGDVKLMAAVGSFLGAEGAFISFLLTALFGGVYALLVILYFRKIFKGVFKQFFNTLLAFALTKKYMPDPLIKDKNKPRLCYGIAIALGTFTYIGLNLSRYEFI